MMICLQNLSLIQRMLLFRKWLYILGVFMRNWQPICISRRIIEQAFWIWDKLLHLVLYVIRVVVWRVKISDECIRLFRKSVSIVRFWWRLNQIIDLKYVVAVHVALIGLRGCHLLVRVMLLLSVVKILNCWLKAILVKLLAFQVFLLNILIAFICLELLIYQRSFLICKNKIINKQGNGRESLN